MITKTIDHELYVSISQAGRDGRLPGFFERKRQYSADADSEGQAPI